MLRSFFDQVLLSDVSFFPDGTFVSWLTDKVARINSKVRYVHEKYILV